MAHYNDIYTTQFDPEIYYSKFYSKESFEHQFACLDYLHECFANGKVKGRTMLDIGCGPSVNGSISASGYVQDITLSDFVDKNLQLVRDWIDRRPNSLDYTPALQHVANLEGIEDHSLLEERVRSKIRNLCHSDVTLLNPLHPLEDTPMEFDIVETMFVLENMETEEKFCQAMKNAASLVRPGGFYICFSTMGATTFHVGDTVIPNLPLHQDLIFRAVKEACLEKVDWKVYNYSTTPSFAENQFALFGLVAQKK